MNRRQFLGVVGGLGSSLAGCLGRSGGLGQRADSPTSSPPIESRVEVPPCPDKPAELTRDTVAEFAVQFEKAYYTRQLLDDHKRVTYVQFKTIAGVGDEFHGEVSQTDDGFLVRFTVTPAYGWRPHPRTANTAHADLGTYTANYFITTHTVYRAKVDDGTPNDPRNTGTVVHCPPEMTNS